MERTPKKETDRVLCLNFNEKVPVAIEGEKIFCLGCAENAVAKLVPHRDGQAISCLKYGHLAPVG